ncbi:hypothetical protein HSX11_16150 [Oxalobacteraceae bacterium]|nr:hypothetical protein [Oxalobacteraceae bacterium]
MQEIFSLNIKCIRGMHLIAPYEFKIQVPATWTLTDLADCILHMMDFDGDHLSQFYVAASLRGRKTSPGANDGADHCDPTLHAIFPLPKNKKLFYLYDFGASWWFQISKQGKSSTGLAEVDYPRLLSEQGSKPLEYGPDDDCD